MFTNVLQRGARPQRFGRLASYKYGVTQALTRLQNAAGGSHSTFANCSLLHFKSSSTSRCNLRSAAQRHRAGFYESSIVGNIEVDFIARAARAAIRKTSRPSTPPFPPQFELKRIIRSKPHASDTRDSTGRTVRLINKSKPALPCAKKSQNSI